MIRPWNLLKIAGGALAFFAIGHTIGTLNAGAPDPAGQGVVDAMRSYHFQIMGSTRTFWDFYIGLNILLSVNLAALTIMSFQLSSLSKTDPRRALPLTLTLVLACVLLAIPCWKYFFVAPALSSTLAALACALAIYELRNVKPTSA